MGVQFFFLKVQCLYRTLHDVMKKRYHLLIGYFNIIPRCDTSGLRFQKELMEVAHACFKISMIALLCSCASLGLCPLLDDLVFTIVNSQNGYQIALEISIAKMRPRRCRNCKEADSPSLTSGHPGLAWHGDRRRLRRAAIVGGCESAGRRAHQGASPLSPMPALAGGAPPRIQAFT